MVQDMKRRAGDGGLQKPGCVGATAESGASRRAENLTAVQGVRGSRRTIWEADPADLYGRHLPGSDVFPSLSLFLVFFFFLHLFHLFL